LLPIWPTYDLLIIPKYALLFGPRWWLLFSVLTLFLFWVYLSKLQRQFSALFVLLSLNYLDFQLPSFDSYFTTNNVVANELKVISYNFGGGGSKEELKLLVKYLQPDILLLQEARRINLTKLFSDDYFNECVSGLCILSKSPFTRKHTLSRKLFGGWGLFAVFYELETEQGQLSLANIHFETPRSVLMGLLHRDIDQKLAIKIENNRRFEADLLSVWSNYKRNTLIVGDFNMPSDENLFRENFAYLKNSIDVQGIGFNETKHTSWYGVRIDHILYTPDMQLIDVKIVELLKGDHQPLMATLRMSNST
jgi:endonuclease/exonuclease/phosphatase (EEP) superfamily protein YafD